MFEELKSAQRMFDSFAALKKEKLSDLIDRFISVANNLKKHDSQLTNHERIQRLLDSLPPEWSLQVKTLKEERSFSDYKLLDVIDKLKYFELDIKRKEFYQIVIQRQTNTTNVALNSIDFKPFEMIEMLKPMGFYSDSNAETGETMKENMFQVSWFMERARKNVCIDDKIEIREVQSQINNASMTKIVDFQKGKSKCEESLKDDEGKKEAEDEEMLEEKEEERKRNTRVCNCDKALAAEKVIMGLPYEVI